VVDNQKSKDVALILGLLIPVLMILFVAAALYLPRLVSTVEPARYDFLYMVGYQYYGNEHYLVKDGHLTMQEAEPDQRYPTPPPGYEARFYHHVVRDNTSHELTFDEAATLTLDSSSVSPDGYSIVPGRKSEFFFGLFSTTDYRTRFLHKDSHTQRLDLATARSSGYFGFTFLGWIVE